MSRPRQKISNQISRLWLTAATFFFCLNADAIVPLEQGQFKFGVGRFSEGIACFNMNLVELGGGDWRAEMSATKDGETHEASFFCSLETEPHTGHDGQAHQHTGPELLCDSKHGSFYLSGTSQRPRIQLGYLNLKPHERGVELDEKFAIYNRDESSSGHDRLASTVGFPGTCSN
ncbi:MAG: hypothetical protein AAF202_10360 [Pseudomonadota bacterium]